MRGDQRPLLLPPGGPLVFPDPRRADEDGLVAVGGDLSVDRLLLAYDRGIFPWYDSGLPPLWWSPDPRAVIDADSLHVSRRLARKLAQGAFEISFDRAYERVMRECASQREGGTWLMPEMIDAYLELHEQGHAHSVEVWMDGRLAGGLYGVCRGGLFAAESMFHRRTDASKIALVISVRSLFAAGIELYDVQFATDHLLSMGAYEIDRDRYLDRLESVRKKPVKLDGLELGWP